MTQSEQMMIEGVEQAVMSIFGLWMESIIVKLVLF